ncbi:MAG: WhiB family transcriptional regulator [Acidimicrobiales bacterium]
MVSEPTPWAPRRTSTNFPRHHELEVLAQAAVRPFESCDSVARPNRPAGAACRGMGPDFFFPTSSVALVRAEQICARCPLADECFATALEDPSLDGIWAGTSSRERQYLRSEEGLGWG